MPTKSKSAINPKTHARRSLNSAVTECRKWMTDHPQALNDEELAELKAIAAKVHRAISAFEVFMK